MIELLRSAAGGWHTSGFGQRSGRRHARTWAHTWARALALPVVITAMLLCESSGANAAEPNARCASSPTISIGLSRRAFSYLPTVVAQEKGFYCDEGLNVVNRMISDAAAPPAVASGGLEYVVNVANVTAAVTAGLPLRMIAMVTSKPYFVLVVSPDIHSVKDLKGKHLAVTSPGSSTTSMLTAVLAANGISAKDVDIQPLGNAESMLAALFSKQVQGAMVYPPFDVEAVRRGYVRLAKSKDISNVPLNTLVTSVSLIQQKPDQVKKVIKATIRGLQYIQSDRQGTMDIMQSSFGLSSDLVGEMYDNYKDIFSPDGTMSDVQIKAAIDDARSRLPAAAKLSIDSLVDRSLLTAVQKEMDIR
jgi:NitT/TauT family transport system substrate-binding protein